ncbi:MULTISPECIES: YccF domain-containing protein [Dermacoccus]|uniref:YccF domain-containing protein n=1 Tax=Dermacoccus abyssi TaxID=322596 RepID=A0ABX5Z6J1_9MICO|nr:MULTISPECIES: YccF domain-containing protein [Dermacoccus]MBZ4498183.1 YccF domain-containing protein [Dermacoccus sp. Tok2021]KLO63825.1 membrane protein [Dermacoccus sp. PE3]MBE7370704.1 YccF domain-containing protein [Dermacoccus barathri]MCT1987856.1 YccF domain-containing protein [Dermacoccus abyssi]QEH92207.1 YccF domain-containing protein [Dermacoccus abyssi]
MKTLLNIIWFVLAGFWLWIAYAVAALVMCILIVTIPFGIASFRIANFAAWPFGRTYIDKPTAGAASMIGNVIWFVFAGLWIALAHIGTAIALAVTIIGIPLAWANLKMIPLALFPLGKEIVPEGALAPPRYTPPQAYGQGGPPLSRY